MRTPAQAAASRANGARSKGPVTPQGKHNSSKNALRHGIFAETVVLETENTPAFLELLNQLWEEHDPQTATEKMLVDTIAAARWKQDRIWGLQKTNFDYDISHPPATPGEPSPSAPLSAVLSLRNSEQSVRAHELLRRYEIALDRQISRALHRLHQLQEKRAKPAAEASKNFRPKGSRIRTNRHATPCNVERK